MLIEAVRQLPAGSFALSVHGDTAISPEYIASLRQRSGGLPVTFAGPFARERADAVYDQLDVLVVPSIWLENSPLVVHEAFMAGVPVVASRIGGLPDLIQHELNGLLFEPGNVDALATALQALLDDPALLHRLRTAQTMVKSIDRDADEWDAAYVEVLGEPETPQP